jgi:hypothetical protein
MTLKEEFDAVAQQVNRWPTEQQVLLAQQILKHVSGNALPPTPRRTLDKAIGLLRGAGPPPSDEEVDRLIEEARFAKYGK